MKALQWILVVAMLLVVSCILVGTTAYITYTLMPAQVVEKPVIVEKYVTVEVPKIITQEVIKTVVVEATPMPIVVEQLPPPVIPTVAPTEVVKSCNDIAYIEMRTGDKIQGDALKVGTIYRLNATLVNAGTCDWVDYKLVSINGDPLDADVPDTLAGQSVNFTVTEGKVRLPLHYMIVLQNANGDIVPFAYGGTLEGCMAWTVETISKNPGFNQSVLNGFTSKLICGAGG